jgi:hypothetical protein
MRGFGSDTSMRGFGSGGMAAPTSGFARGGSSGFGARGPTSIESAYRKPTDNTGIRLFHSLLNVTSRGYGKELLL